MKKYILISGLAILGLTVSCSNDKTTTEETETTVPENSTIEAPMNVTEGGTATESQPLNMQDGSASAPQQMTASPAPASGNTAGVRLNPAHGEPGHRCEIEVGKPLPPDGTPAAQTAPPQNMQIQGSGQPQPINVTPSSSAPTSIMTTPAPSAPSAAPATSGTTAPGMNPPHGEPGHDCAIPVGQPLKK